MFRFLQHISPIRIASAVIIIVVAFAMYWRVTGRRRLDDITLPAGFTIAMYSENVPNARQMAWGDNGTVFVGSRRAGNVYAVVDRDGDNVAEETYAIASDLTLPSGIAFYDGALYVAAVSRVLRYDDIESRLTNPPQPVVIRDDLPAETHHGWKFIQFGPDGLLYIPVGAPCNTCDPSDGHGGTIADPEYGNDRACGEFTPRPKHSAHTLRRSGCGFMWVTCFRHGTATISSSRSTAPGIAAPRSATA